MAEEPAIPGPVQSMASAKPMPFTAHCPNCDQAFQFDESQLDQTTQCAKCRTTFPLIPGSRVAAPGEEPAFSAFLNPHGEDLPSTMGRYRILAKIGGGAMGVVYLAEDPKLKNRRVAIKVPLKDYKRFQREAEIAALFHHPNFCPIYDIGVDNCVPFLVMK